MADANQEEILKAAQNEISAVMKNAMGNISGSAQSKDSEPSEFLKQHLSNESQTEEVQLNGLEYVEPMQDPYNKAIKYLENHNILQLFQQLTASIVYTKPDKPLEFMMTEVERMKREKQSE